MIDKCLVKKAFVSTRTLGVLALSLHRESTDSLMMHTELVSDVIDPGIKLN